MTIHKIQCDGGFINEKCFRVFKTKLNIAKRANEKVVDKLLYSIHLQQQTTQNRKKG